MTSQEILGATPVTATHETTQKIALYPGDVEKIFMSPGDVEIGISDYIKEHGRAPSGVGDWIFFFIGHANSGRPCAPIVVHRSLYSAAASYARQRAARLGFKTLRLLP